MLSFTLCWSPVILLMVLAVCFRMSALHLSWIGSLFTLLLVVGFFDTPFTVALLAALDGVLTMLPLLLVVVAGILLATLLQKTGSLNRIVNWLMSGVHTALHRGLLIVFGVTNFMEGASVIAEPVVAPMLLSAGVTPFGAAALSIIGYAGLMTLEMAGIIITVLSLVTGIPVYELGVASAWLSIPATVMLAACVPVFMQTFYSEFNQFLLTLGCGLFVSIATLIIVIWVGVSVSGMMGGLALVIVMLTTGTCRIRISGTILRDMSPFILMLAALLMVNTIPALRELTLKKLSITVHVVSIHCITYQPFFSAYLYLFAACGLSVILFKIPLPQMREIIQTGLIKGWRATVAMGLFGAMGQMIAFSGYTDNFLQMSQSHNIPWVLAHGLQHYTGNLYPLFVPFLGWVGTFLTGYGVASLMLFGQLQVEAAALLNVSAIWLASALAVGASLGSVSSPFKIAIATPMCGAIGLEGTILRWTIPIGAGAALLVGVVLLMIL
jgi:lactate permease